MIVEQVLVISAAYGFFLTILSLVAGMAIEGECSLFLRNLWNILTIMGIFYFVFPLTYFIMARGYDCGVVRQEVKKEFPYALPVGVGLMLVNCGLSAWVIVEQNKVTKNIVCPPGATGPDCSTGATGATDSTGATGATGALAPVEDDKTQEKYCRTYSPAAYYGQILLIINVILFVGALLYIGYKEVYLRWKKDPGVVSEEMLKNMQEEKKRNELAQQIAQQRAEEKARYAQQLAQYQARYLQPPYPQPQYGVIRQ